MTAKELLGVARRLRARANLYKNKPKEGEEIVARALDEVADAIEEELNEPADFED